jgi:hypothetical protein
VEKEEITFLPLHPYFITVGAGPWHLVIDTRQPVFILLRFTLMIQFPKRAGYYEDPATGLAASALGAYLIYYSTHQN